MQQWGVPELPRGRVDDVWTDGFSARHVVGAGGGGRAAWQEITDGIILTDSVAGDGKAGWYESGASDRVWEYYCNLVTPVAAGEYLVILLESLQCYHSWSVTGPIYNASAKLYPLYLEDPVDTGTLTWATRPAGYYTSPDSSAGNGADLSIVPYGRDVYGMTADGTVTRAISFLIDGSNVAKCSALRFLVSLPFGVSSGINNGYATWAKLSQLKTGVLPWT